jgi:type III pantothenate kinase
LRLCIDIGNSRTKIGVYDPGRQGKDEWIASRSERKLSADTLRQLLAEFHINAAVLSCTRDYDPALAEVLGKLDRFIELDHCTPLPVLNHYASPQTLGKDRLAAVCGAHHLFPDENVLVIDAGTCITMDMIDSGGNYYGGSIHPGITMRYRALNNYTGKLPLVKRRLTEDLSGDTTESAITSGVQYAVIREIDGMIDDYRVKKGELKVIITGGDAPFFVSRLKSKIFAHSNLVLTGLSKILDHNAEGLE